VEAVLAEPTDETYTVPYNQPELLTNNGGSECDVTTTTKKQKLTAQEPLKIRSSSEPVNEFECNDLLLYLAFAFLFIFGRGLHQTGSVPTKAIRHMMFQFTGRFAACTYPADFLFIQPTATACRFPISVCPSEI